MVTQERISFVVIIVVIVIVIVCLFVRSFVRSFVWLVGLIGFLVVRRFGDQDMVVANFEHGIRQRTLRFPVLRQ